MTAEKNHARAVGLLFLALFVLFSLPVPLRAAQALVNGQYLSGTGQDIQLRITVANPSPTTLIVVQNLPIGMTIEAATPAFHQYDASKGEVKWLLTRISPGSYTVTLRLQRAAVPGEISGEIRYKEPASGRMINLSIRP